MTEILGREEADKRTTGRFYVVAEQAVLLFGYETWVQTPWLDKALTGFHHQTAWRMEGMVPKYYPDGTWVYPPIGAALAMVELEEIRVFITRRHNTAVQYIATHPIMYFCLAADQKPGMRLSRRWGGEDRYWSATGWWNS